ncbi:MAG TPA: DUF4173 domain-containing protein [Phycisphaerae bacterium]|nr:DUF4173 domain-containing protein [Phycisphaerae bacterium]HNU44249.1 DUF4173 domain-containing protein [Phycisphaerae bacterium]
MSTRNDDSQRAAAGAVESLPSGTPAAVSRGEFGLLLVLVLGLVVLADWLFWQQPRGWTIGAYGLLLTGAVLAWERRLPRRVPAVVVTAALVALLVQCLEEPGLLAMTLSVLGLFTLGLILREGWSASSVEWLRRWVLLGVIGWQTMFRDAHACGHAAGGAGRGGLRFLRGWSIPLLLTVLFLLLFCVANPVLSRWLSDAWHGVRELLLQLVDWSPSGGRIVMWLLVGVAVWTLLRFRSGAGGGRYGASPAAETTALPSVAPTFIVRSLVLFNAVFALETLLDIRYLWAGAQLPAGLTYAQYAHRGAFPLVAAAMLAAVFVLVTFRAGSREASSGWARRLVYLWLAQNLLLVASAAWRLCLYVDAYSLTRWRVAAAIWMLLVLCGLAWILLRIVARRSSVWLINVNLLTAMVVLYACAFVNFDGWIGSFNVTHCLEVRGEGPRIDLAYLEHLGPETLPALARLVETSGDPTILARARATMHRLDGGLRDDLRAWRGWTWRRQRLGRIDLPPEGGNLAAPN